MGHTPMLLSSNIEEKQMRREVLGIFVVLGVGACFALSNTLAGLAYTGGANHLSVSTVRYFLPAIILIIVLSSTGKPIWLPKREGLVACALGFVTAIYSWSVLAAIEVLPVSLAVLIFYLFPLITSFLVVMMGWERLRMTTIVSAIVAFAGLALALGVSADALNPIGIALAAVGALGLAIVSVVSSRVIRTGDARQVTLYIATTTAVIFLLVTLVRGEFLLPSTTAAWWGFVSNNLFFAAALIGYFVRHTDDRTRQDDAVFLHRARGDHRCRAGHTVGPKPGAVAEIIGVLDRRRERWSPPVVCARGGGPQGR